MVEPHNTPPTGISATHVRIWNTVRHIPKGRVSTYGTIARLAGFGSHARLVGYALHALPDGIDLPWHRVINAQGRISLPATNGASRRQITLLKKEGIRMSKGKVDLKKYGWPVRNLR